MLKKLHMAKNAKTVCGKDASKVHVTQGYFEVTCKQCLGVQSPKQIEAQKKYRVLGALGMMQAQIQTLRLISDLNFNDLNDIEFMLYSMKQRMKK